MGNYSGSDQISSQQIQTVVVRNQGTLQLNYSDQHLKILEQLFQSMKSGVARQSEIMDNHQQQKFERKIEVQEMPNALQTIMLKFIVLKENNFKFKLESTFTVCDPLNKNQLLHKETIYFDSKMQSKQENRQFSSTHPQNVLLEIEQFYFDMVNNIKSQEFNKRQAPSVFQQQIIQQPNQISNQYQLEHQRQLQLQQIQQQQQIPQQNMPQVMAINQIPQQIFQQQPLVQQQQQYQQQQQQQQQQFYPIQNPYQ
ncbi:hypothetical protein ABPG74_002158 [Tetrahymena malaccensis]